MPTTEGVIEISKTPEVESHRKRDILAHANHAHARLDLLDGQAQQVAAQLDGLRRRQDVIVRASASQTKRLNELTGGFKAMAKVLFAVLEPVDEAAADPAAAQDELDKANAIAEAEFAKRSAAARKGAETRRLNRARSAAPKAKKKGSKK